MRIIVANHSHFYFLLKAPDGAKGNFVGNGQVLLPMLICHSVLKIDLSYPRRRVSSDFFLNYLRF